MDDPPEESGNPHVPAPFSQREINSLLLAVGLARSESEIKEILDVHGVTPGEFDDLPRGPLDLPGSGAS
ncbi:MULTISPECIES: hypothetical protein [unclassified Streptomyces]|uniref:hypothetical protein n=1 Tax=Streptomyces TaxID=1883 RepID=UPI00081B3AB8|nr:MULTISPECIES: hypothetical protein [unclassified Streptomyces]MYQ63923.1 hypothetical protein [Streptomyces sp. SID4950]SCD68280.1 hypothetical protein GA0115242_112046 [Streptomyces sp. SolWspMP-5a-2]